MLTTENNIAPRAYSGDVSEQLLLLFKTVSLDVY